MSGNSPPTEPAPSSPVPLPREDRGASRIGGGRRVLVHLCRLAIFIAVLVIIRFAQPAPNLDADKLDESPIAMDFVGQAYSGSQIGPW